MFYNKLYALARHKGNQGVATDQSYWIVTAYVCLLNEEQQLNLGYFVMHHFFLQIKNIVTFIVYYVPIKPILFGVFDIHVHLC